MLTSILLALGTAAAIGSIAWARHATARACVVGALGRVHAVRVTLTPDWFDMDRDTMTYDVEYSTQDGQRHSNRCKVAIHAGSDHSVYWEHALKSAE